MPINTSRVEFPVKKAEDVLSLIADTKVFIVADIETTGFGPYDDIIEIGAVKIDADSKKVLRSFSTLCSMRNHKKVPAKITELTTIRTEDLAGAPNIEVVLSRFKAFVGDDPIVFHNASFDWRMLNTKYKMLGTRLNNECICSMKLFKFLHPEVGGSNLEVVTTYYGSRIEGHHRAVIDCKWTAAAFCRMRDEVLSITQEITLGGPLPNTAPVKTLSLTDLQNSCIIQRISGWNKKGQHRIYCTTNVADFFYDVTNHVWNVARNKTSYDLDINALAQFVLGKLGISLTEFQERYMVA